MAKRIKTPPVTPERRLDWLRRNEENGESPPQIAKRDALMDCINRMIEQQRPSLVSRFEKMAGEAKMLGWQKDVLAFKKFNSMRNALLHRGRASITTRITLSEEEVCDLEDLVERYVSFMIFGDGHVYPSRFRLMPTKKPA